jgi:hypothetical protein
MNQLNPMNRDGRKSRGKRATALLDDLGSDIQSNFEDEARYPQGDPEATMHMIPQEEIDPLLQEQQEEDEAEEKLLMQMNEATRISVLRSRVAHMERLVNMRSVELHGLLKEMRTLSASKDALLDRVLRLESLSRR